MVLLMRHIFQFLGTQSASQLLPLPSGNRHNHFASTKSATGQCAQPIGIYIVMFPITAT